VSVCRRSTEVPTSTEVTETRDDEPAKNQKRELWCQPTIETWDVIQVWGISLRRVHQRKQATQHVGDEHIEQRKEEYTCL
jgi:hypothetical protein